MHCKCCCQTNIPGYPLIWIEQDKRLICSALSLLVFHGVEIFFFFLPPLICQTEQDHSSQAAKWTDSPHNAYAVCCCCCCCTTIWVFLLIALVKCPHVVYVFLQQRWDAGATHMEPLLWSYQGFAHRSQKEMNGSWKSVCHAARHLEVSP